MRNSFGAFDQCASEEDAIRRVKQRWDIRRMNVYQRRNAREKWAFHTGEYNNDWDCCEMLAKLLHCSTLFDMCAMSYSAVRPKV